MKNTAIITGASSGIGKAIAQKFLSHGAEVINISRKSCDLDQVKNIQLDLSDLNNIDAVKKNLSFLFKKKQRIHLVHNACKHVNDTVGNQNAADLVDALNIAIVFPALINNLLYKYMNAGSSIIYMGSTLSEKAVPNTATYTTVKHAMVGLMRSTVQDLSQYGIHSACICPGFTDTEMLRMHLSHFEQGMEIVKQKTAFARLIEPSEIADVAYFAATHAVLNGAVIHANLGQIES